MNFWRLLRNRENACISGCLRGVSSAFSLGLIRSSSKIRVIRKVNDEYAVVKDMPVASTREGGVAKPGDNGLQSLRVPAPDLLESLQMQALLIVSSLAPAKVGGNELALLPAQSPNSSYCTSCCAAPAAPTVDRTSTAITTTDRYQPSAAVMKRLPSKRPKPVWHPPWVNYKIFRGLSYSSIRSDRHTFTSASADNNKKFPLTKEDFLHNMLSQQRATVNCMSINEDNVMVSTGDNGSFWFWDYKSGHNFQQAQTIVQPGSLDSEAGIYALSYDQTGSRLIPCEAEETIEFWKEDEKATPESHPVHFRPPKAMRRF